MIKEYLCMKLIRFMLYVFGMQTFAISAVCALPAPVLIVIDEYLKDVPE